MRRWRPLRQVWAEPESAGSEHLLAVALRRDSRAGVVVVTELHADAWSADLLVEVLTC